MEPPNRTDGAPLPPPRLRWQSILWTMFASSLAMLVIGLANHAVHDSTGAPLIMAPLGASAVLVFGIHNSPFAQPRNVVGGHTLSALAGVTVYQLMGGGNEIVSVALAVPLAMGLMHSTGTMHPPGGATAFLGAAGGEAFHAMGYWFVLTPCLAGSATIILMALILNNIPPRQRYPAYW